MKASYLWLKEFVDFDLSPEELSKLLRTLGFETASLTRVGGEILNVVTAKVMTREKHPNADKLSLCTVFDGTDTWNVVCGAPNVAAGQTVPLARVGARLPGGMTIEKAVIRGQESHGMLCSTRELGLSEDHSGIMVLPEDTPLGEDIAKTLMLGDAILDLEVTPNRPDALSHWGLAREIAAAFDKIIRMPDMKVSKVKTAMALVQNEAPTLCFRYVGRVIEGVTVKASPLWMRLRLERCGIRSINNLVDVTNYVLLELGQPLHVFDREKLAEGRVIVRLGKAGEKVEGLDGVTRSAENALVIADAQKPAALAGIMGGQPSAVLDGTRHVLLESAQFLPAQIRRTRTRLNVSTESSYRFERGTDWDICEMASRRAAHLILSLAGGTLISEQDARGREPSNLPVKVNADRIQFLLGMDIASEKMKQSLERLGFACTGAGKMWNVTPPIHRQDVREEADVAEEVARLEGYDNVPDRRRASTQAPEPVARERQLILTARRHLTGLGFYEAKNYGLAARRDWEKLNGDSMSAVELDNPLSATGEILSPSLLLNLLLNLQSNVRRGNANARLFETARVFSRGDDKIDEHTSLAMAVYGADHSPHWKFKSRPLEIWDVKNWMKSLAMDWRVPAVRFDKSDLPVFLHPSESQSVWLGDHRIGIFGRLHPKQADAWDVPRSTFLGEINLTAFSLAQPLELKFQGLPKFPAVIRDFSLVFPDTAAWSAIALALFRANPWVAHVELFDVFVDESLPPDHRSLAFRISFRDAEKTLTDVEIGKVQDNLVALLQKEFNAAPRAVSLKS